MGVGGEPDSLLYFYLLMHCTALACNSVSSFLTVKHTFIQTDIVMSGQNLRIKSICSRP